MPFPFCFDRAICGLLLCGFRFLRCLTTRLHFARCYAFGPFRHRTLALIEHPRENQISSIDWDADKANQKQNSSTEEMLRQGAAVRSRGAFRRFAPREPCTATGPAAHHAQQGEEAECVGLRIAPHAKSGSMYSREAAPLVHAWQYPAKHDIPLRELGIAGSRQKGAPRLDTLSLGLPWPRIRPRQEKCWRGTEAPRPCCRYLSFHGPPRHR
jgi:hypothetical protein